MLVENSVFWQCLLFIGWGYLVAAVLHSMFGYPQRLIEAM